MDKIPSNSNSIFAGSAGFMHCIILKYEVQLCYYNDNINSNPQAGQQNIGTHCYGQLVHVLQKTQFTSFQSIYGCLSVYRHNVSPRSHNRCLSRLSLPTFKLLFHVLVLRSTIVHRNIKIYSSNVKTLHFLEKLCSASTVLSTLQLWNQQTDCHCCAIKKNSYTNFQSYIHFIKCRMCQVFAQWVTYYFFVHIHLNSIN